MEEWTIIAKDWEFTSDLLVSWKRFGFVFVSSTVGKLNKSNLEPFLQDLSEKGIDDTEFQAYSVIIRPRRKKPKERSVALG
jgi:hypothetical protein